MAELALGIARARLGPAAALVDTDRGVAACEENRLTRARQASTFGPPALAISELTHYLGRSESDIKVTAAVREDDTQRWFTGDAVAIEPHHAHAEYGFRASGFHDAVVLVCDTNVARGWTAWRYRERGTASAVPLDAGIGDFPIAKVYGELTAALGLEAGRDEHLVEAMARAAREDEAVVADRIRLTDDGIVTDKELRDVLANAAARDGEAKLTVAAAVQKRLGVCLTALLSRLAQAADTRRICLSGGLFFNTYLTTTAMSAGVFDETFIPAHPGRNGSALGAAVLGLGDIGGGTSAALSSAYLGPGYTDPEVKAALENCKLAFDLQREDQVIATVIRALARGRLVGWFHGRLEWGPRALGHRTVLADPFSPHVLENLNGYLKKRPGYRTYGVSIPRARLSEFFQGTAASPFMQYEYAPRDPEKFRGLLPAGVKTLRVHTVDESEPRCLRLLNQWEESSGAPVLVNTSFNGFHEPLVCSPRDAIRVFYGTGLDLLALEDFVLRK